MRLILTLTLLLLTLIPSRAQTLKFNVNPICLAAKLAEQPDSTKIASICKYYGYNPYSNQGDYTVVQNTDGSQIRFTVKDGINGKKYPIIELKTKATAKEVDGTLQDLKYQKQGHFYEHRIIGRTIRCSSVPNGMLRFTTDN